MGKVKYHKDGFVNIRNDRRVREDLRQRAEKLARASGGQEMGYKVTPLVLEGNRAAVSVMATGKARMHNRKHHALLRNLGAAK